MPIVSAARFLESKLDFVVIGGGTSGLAVAARLSEDPSVTVGVLEAGEYHPDAPGINVPGLMGSLTGNPTYDWNIPSVPQKYAGGRSVIQPRGFALGGSSMLNYMCLTRPTRGEYDALEKHLGNEGWNWDSLSECIKKSESVHIPPQTLAEVRSFGAEPDLKSHGETGPISKSYPLYWADVHVPILGAFEALGIERNQDANGGSNVGAISNWVSVDPRTARRSYSASGYFEPNSDRPNLLILTGARVVKIELSESAGLQKAVGVSFVKDGETRTVGPVEKEVIVSAGAILTPQILELSGIGDPEILSKHGIATLVDLPGVGSNFQDHSLVPTVVELKGNTGTVDAFRDPVELDRQQGLYAQQKGILSTPAAPIFAFIPATTLGNEEDIQKLQQEAQVHTKNEIDQISREELRRGRAKLDALQGEWFVDNQQPQAELLHFNGCYPIPDFTPTPDQRFLTLLCAVMHPKSFGTVHIVSNDPLVPPAVDPNYVSHPLDLDISARSLDLLLKVYDTAPLKEHIKDYISPSRKDVETLRSGSEESRLAWLKEYTKKNVGSESHLLGSAAMMPLEDGGIVDSRLKVYGTSNLRVVDMSIFPFEPSAHVVSTAYAIGEKAAEILKSEYGLL